LFAVFPVSSGLLGVGFLRLLQASFYESRGYWWIILRWKLVSIKKYENRMWRHKVYDNVIMKFVPKRFLKLISSKCASFRLTTSLLCLMDVFSNTHSAFLWVPIKIIYVYHLRINSFNECERSCLILLWTSIGCFWSLVCSISCVIRSPGRDVRASNIDIQVGTFQRQHSPVSESCSSTIRPTEMWGIHIKPQRGFHPEWSSFRGDCD
jgi:hypothetical protein